MTQDTRLLHRDHLDWLLAAAYNFLTQQAPDRAVTLLELVCLADPGNLQGRKMLACAWVEAGKADRALSLLDQLLEERLSADDRLALTLLQLRCLQQQGVDERFRRISARFRELLAQRQSTKNGAAR